MTKTIFFSESLQKYGHTKKRTDKNKVNGHILHIHDREHGPGTQRGVSAGGLFLPILSEQMAVNWHARLPIKRECRLVLCRPKRFSLLGLVRESHLKY